MLIGVIADDFTGASDVANTLAQGAPPHGGLTTAQHIGVPTGTSAKNVDAGVIALKTRSTEPQHAIEQSLAALEWLMAQGCQQIVFKYCSTFDSTPKGNIGPVAQALANALNVNGVAVCPAFPGAGRTVYQGHLFVFDQLLNESGMQNHPITPMTDPDIRRWLSQQITGTVGHVNYSDVLRGSDAIANVMAQSADSGDLFCVIDAATDEDLVQLGQALRGQKLVTGGSGIAMGLPHHWHVQGLTHPLHNEVTGTLGLSAILAGSCSGATRQQIDHHADTYPTFQIDIDQLMHDEVSAADLVVFIESHQDSLPLVYSSSSPEIVESLQRKFGAQAVADKLDDVFSNTAAILFQQGYARLVIAGGETSSAVAMKLSEMSGEEAFHIGPQIDPGVPVLYLRGPSPMALALKSGNFGGENFFEHAFGVMTNGG